MMILPLGGAVVVPGNCLLELLEEEIAKGTVFYVSVRTSTSSITMPLALL
jgi:hypothetical protein